MNFDIFKRRPHRFCLLPWALLGLLVVSLSACDSSKTIEFPEQIAPGYAFVVYENGGEAVDISTVRDSSYYSSLVVSAKNSFEFDTIELYTIDPTQLTQLANSECRKLDSIKGRVACLQAIEGCKARADCWQVKTFADGCGEALSLKLEDSILEYYRESGGIFVPQSSASAKQMAFSVCGPIVQPNCPFKTPTYVVTKNGYFHCNADAAQQSCNLSLDFSSCGIGEITGTLNEAGQFDATTNTIDRCTIQASSDETPSSLGAADFSIVCPNERYDVTYSDNLLGTQDCPRLGPSTYDNDSNIGGEITGVTTVDDKYSLMVGSGDNLCAYYGYYCSLREGLCIDCCYDTCNAYLMTRCIERDDQTTCAEPPRTDCIEQCRKCCSDSSNCTRSYREGHSAVVVDLEKPYTFESRVKLEPTGRVYPALHRGQAIAPLHSSSSSHQFVAAFERGAVFLALINEKELVKANQGITTDFAVRGLYHQKQTTYLTGALTSSIAAMLVVDYTDLTKPEESFSTQQFEFPSIQQIEHLVRSDSALFLASSRYIDGNAVSKVTAFAPTTMDKINEIEVPGQISLLHYYQDSIIVSSFDELTHQETIYFFDGDLSPQSLGPLPMLRGLAIQYSLVDKESGRIYLGLKIVSRAGSLGSGALSVLEPSGAGYRVLPPLFVSNTGAIDLLSLSKDGKKLFAFSRAKNWIMPFDIFDEN